MQRISFVTTHFYDFDWTRLWLRQINRYVPSDYTYEFIVINQDRTEESRSKLQSLDTRIRVVEYSQSQSHFVVTGHDHGHVLNCVLQDVEGDYMCLFDSDAHPFSHQWLPICSELLEKNDAILSQTPQAPELTHPCFMLFKRKVIQSGLAFDEGLFDRQIDTGRLVGQQLQRGGFRYHSARPEKAFGGKWGSIYLGSVYHHGHGSFKGGDDRLRNQLTARHDFFRRIVMMRGEYSLTLPERVGYHLRFSSSKYAKRMIHNSTRVR